MNIGYGTVNNERWMLRHNIFPECYGRHPDTGSPDYIAAYLYASSHQDVLIRIFDKQGWKFLRHGRHHSELVFVKPNRKSL